MRKAAAFTIVLALSFMSRIRGWKAIEDSRDDPSLYSIGLGIYDITGPAEGVNMMGYANPAQLSKGIHMRLYSRTFIIDDGLRRLVFVNADCGMGAQSVKTGVVEELQREYNSSLYTEENVIFSGTHTHSGPAGYLEYLLYDITSLGFIPQTYDAMVKGTVESIKMAHENMILGRARISKGELVDASANRSPSAYENNPKDELDKYEHNTDKTMFVLKLEDSDGNPVGMFNWYAVHATSMNNTNSLISGDNKGYASQLFEKHMDPESLPGQGAFVGAFAQANCGDISPNTKGPKCIDTGLDCDILHSSCGGRSQKCIASGPGKDMVESTKIIGELQFQKALELFESPDQTLLTGPVSYAHEFVDMSNYTVKLSDGTEVKTCKPALGYSFAAGTTDGPGAFDFTQGMTEENPFWNSVVDFIKPTEPEQEICHEPKPVLLDTGNYNLPYDWHPHIIETQIGFVGQLIIGAVPGEFTSMAGRRFKDKLSETASNKGMEDPIVVLAGLSNTYTHYITTVEEYAIQRYEGASTLFGPNTLEAYLQQYSLLVTEVADGDDIMPGESPPDLRSQQISLLPEIMYDRPSDGYEFGSVVAQPYPFAYVGETIITKFASGSPRNDVKLGGTFLTVEMKSGTDWKVIANDANWETRFHWERISTLFGTSEITIYWDIPEDTPSGTYRIKHFGDYKAILSGRIRSYEGVTMEFEVAELPVEDEFVQQRKEHKENKEEMGFFQLIKSLLG